MNGFGIRKLTRGSFWKCHLGFTSSTSSSLPGRIYPSHPWRVTPQRCWCATAAASAQRCGLLRAGCWDCSYCSYCLSQHLLSSMRVLCSTYYALGHPTQSLRSPFHHGHRKYQSRSIACPARTGEHVSKWVSLFGWKSKSFLYQKGHLNFDK